MIRNIPCNLKELAKEAYTRELIMESKEEGRKEGRKEEREKMSYEVANKLIEEGASPELISKVSNLDMSVINSLLLMK